MAVVGGIAGTHCVCSRACLTDLAFDLPWAATADPPMRAPRAAFAIVRVADRAAREVTGDAGGKGAREDQWFAGEYRFHRVSFHGFNNGYDAETDAWVTWQLRRMRRMGQ